MKPHLQKKLAIGSSRQKGLNNEDFNIKVFEIERTKDQKVNKVQRKSSLKGGDTSVEDPGPPTSPDIKCRRLKCTDLSWLNLPPG